LESIFEIMKDLRKYIW